MNDVTKRKIKNLLTSADNVRNAKNDTQRRAAMTFMTQRATELTAIRDDLETKLNDGWEWIEDEGEANASAELQQWLTWEADYRAICDALNDASGMWTWREAA